MNYNKKIMFILIFLILNISFIFSISVTDNLPQVPINSEDLSPVQQTFYTNKLYSDYLDVFESEDYFPNFEGCTAHNHDLYCVINTKHELKFNFNYDHIYILVKNKASSFLNIASLSNKIYDNINIYKSTFEPINITFKDINIRNLFVGSLSKTIVGLNYNKAYIRNLYLFRSDYGKDKDDATVYNINFDYYSGIKNYILKDVNINLKSGFFSLNSPGLFKLDTLIASNSIINLGNIFADVIYLDNSIVDSSEYVANNFYVLNSELILDKLKTKNFYMKNMYYEIKKLYVNNNNAIFDNVSFISDSRVVYDFNFIDTNVFIINHDFAEKINANIYMKDSYILFKDVSSFIFNIFNLEIYNPQKYVFYLNNANIKFGFHILNGGIFFKLGYVIKKLDYILDFIYLYDSNIIINSLNIFSSNYVGLFYPSNFALDGTLITGDNSKVEIYNSFFSGNGRMFDLNNSEVILANSFVDLNSLGLINNSNLTMYFNYINADPLNLVGNGNIKMFNNSIVEKNLFKGNKYNISLFSNDSTTLNNNPICKTTANNSLAIGYNIETNSYIYTTESRLPLVIGNAINYLNLPCIGGNLYYKTTRLGNCELGCFKDLDGDFIADNNYYDLGIFKDTLPLVYNEGSYTLKGNFGSKKIFDFLESKFSFYDQYGGKYYAAEKIIGLGLKCSNNEINHPIPKKIIISPGRHLFCAKYTINGKEYSDLFDINILSPVLEVYKDFLAHYNLKPSNYNYVANQEIVETDGIMLNSLFGKYILNIKNIDPDVKIVLYKADSSEKELFLPYTVSYCFNSYLCSSSQNETVNKLILGFSVNYQDNYTSDNYTLITTSKYYKDIFDVNLETPESVDLQFNNKNYYVLANLDKFNYKINIVNLTDSNYSVRYGVSSDFDYKDFFTDNNDDLNANKNITIVGSVNLNNKKTGLSNLYLYLTYFQNLPDAQPINKIYVFPIYGLNDLPIYKENNYYSSIFIPKEHRFDNKDYFVPGSFNKKSTVVSGNLKLNSVDFNYSLGKVRYYFKIQKGNTIYYGNAGVLSSLNDHPVFDGYTYTTKRIPAGMGVFLILPQIKDKPLEPGDYNLILYTYPIINGLPKFYFYDLNIYYVLPIKFNPATEVVFNVAAKSTINKDENFNANLNITNNKTSNIKLNFIDINIYDIANSLIKTDRITLNQDLASGNSVQIDYNKDLNLNSGNYKIRFNLNYTSSVNNSFGTLYFNENTFSNDVFLTILNIKKIRTPEFSFYSLLLLLIVISMIYYRKVRI